MAKKLVLLVFILAAVFSVYRLGTSTTNAPTPIPPDTVKAETASPLYIVKSYGDIIGIFHYGEDIPFRLLSISANSLPQQDIENLKVGIPLYSDEDLFSIIEDFDS
ncbi:MAG: hypothetical protein IKT35_01390 [Clostridia bacterium]|nr:hypothetical protein [Clostridia bacterium]